MTRWRENLDRIEWTFADPEWRPTREYVEKLIKAYRELVEELERKK